jgi:hypothetical protein
MSEPKVSLAISQNLHIFEYTIALLSFHYIQQLPYKKVIFYCYHLNFVQNTPGSILLMQNGRGSIFQMQNKQVSIPKIALNRPTNHGHRALTLTI